MLNTRFQVVVLFLAMALYVYCVPPGGANQGGCVAVTTHRPCIFPFKYQGAMYHECTRAGGSQQPWCATRTNSRTKKLLRMEDCDLELCDFEGDLGTAVLQGPPVVGCKEDNINYDGADTGPPSRQLTWEICKIKCRDTNGCEHWTFRTADGSCWLKSARRMTSHAPGFISGPKNCNAPGGIPCRSDGDCLEGYKCITRGGIKTCRDLTSSSYVCCGGGCSIVSSIRMPCYEGSVCLRGKCVPKTSPDYECYSDLGLTCPGGARCYRMRCRGGIYANHYDR